MNLGWAPSWRDETASPPTPSLTPIFLSSPGTTTSVLDLSCPRTWVSREDHGMWPGVEATPLGKDIFILELMG